MKSHSLLYTTLLLLCLLHTVTAGAILSADPASEDAPPADPFFETNIRPILVNHCYDCHSADQASANLRLDTRDGWVRGGERGPAIVPGDPAASLLISAVLHSDAELMMPPNDAGGRLSEQQIQDLTTWIRRGAYDPRHGDKIVTNIEVAAATHWAFQPIRSPAIGTDTHPIDFLVAQKQQQRGFVSNERADMHTLIRRASFDLVGLPPTPEQLTTTRDDFPKLIDSLLASPRYGERWGRHWLDVARYSDAKDGVLMYGDARVRPFAYTYRDYVIRAFNDDLPFDQFIRQQLAADQMGFPDGSPELAALGLLTLGRMFDRNPHDVIDDQIDVVARGLLGLTISCARCHDHKFDPIPTADYYSLYGVFASCQEPYDRPRIASVTEDGQAFEQEFSAKLQEVYTQQQSHYEATLQTARERTADYLVHIATTKPDVSETAIFFLSLTPEQLRPQITKRWRQLIAKRAFPEDPVFAPWYDMMRQPDLKPEAWISQGVDPRIVEGLVARNPKSVAEMARAYGEVLIEAWQESIAVSQSPGESELDNSDESDPLVSLLLSHQSPIWFPQEDVANYLSRTPGDAYRGLLAELDAIAVRHPHAAARAMVVTDTKILCDPVIFQRGDPSLRGTPVPRQFLEILTSENREPFAYGSGRLELANAIVSPDNPLTARVWVNRVWMHHFGEPLVNSPSDFGLQTAEPVQRELLDFLADFLVRNDWKTKPLHELIMTSNVYQLASQTPASEEMIRQREADPDFSLLWRANRRRLDLEQMRDAILSISGELDASMYGRPLSITDTTNHRRTVYAFVERQNIPSVVQTFDFANADTSTPRRITTTVPQQALFSMNSGFMLERSKALAERARAVTTTDRTQQLMAMFEFVYGRKPQDDELAMANDFMQASTLEQFAQVLLMSNELMFID